MHHTAAVCDLAVTLTSVLRNTADEQLHDAWELTAATLLGYQRHRQLAPAEIDVLGDLVLARLGLTLAIAARRVVTEVGQHRLHRPVRRPHPRVLAQWCAEGPDALTDRLHRMAGTGGRTSSTRPPARTTTPRDGRSTRAAFYDRPLEIVRGEGPWLIAADGTRYLDAYNNVAVVGHAHPAVTQAVSRQLAELNTHSRYLHPRIVELAERLLATVPADSTPACSPRRHRGQRARLAHGDRPHRRQRRRRRRARLPRLLGVDGRPQLQRVAGRTTGRPTSPPSPPRGPRREAPTTPLRPRRIAAAADDLTRAGDRPALVLADIGFTSEGILDAPPTFLAGSRRRRAPGRRPVPGRRGPVGLRPQRPATVALLGCPDHAGLRDAGQADGRWLPDRSGHHPSRDRRQPGPRHEYFSTFAATPAAPRPDAPCSTCSSPTGCPSPLCGSATPASSTRGSRDRPARRGARRRPAGGHRPAHPGAAGRPRVRRDRARRSGHPGCWPG